MELQLGLSLSTNNFESKGMMGFKLWRNDECLLDKKKRSFEDAFVKNTNYNKGKETSLPLLSWSGQPNDEDDDEQRKRKRLSCPIDENDGVVAEEEEQVVGWPPIKSWRKKLLHHQQHGGRPTVKNRVAAAASAGNENNQMNGGSNYKYVKVKMEGVAIARKIDLRLFHSYQTLTNFLISMFGKCEKGDDDSTTNYTLTYQDKDGDWLLAGDVPWQTFMESVQRLELVRNGG